MLYAYKIVLSFDIRPVLYKIILCNM